ncbi:MAG: LON peptidase substrate-binding domain-containing protein [Pseudomonadota bacterium]|nr:LON peptidase substrate-binding domain-containing protein [Pseudomonadota bacterium]
MIEKKIPLFPLQTVLFPGGPLPLRVFESRYLDMISSCMKNSTPFGVVLFQGTNDSSAITMASVGTSASIVDWYQGTDGLLGITAYGEKRFRLISVKQQEDGLNLGTVEFLPPEPEISLPENYLSMSTLLRAVIDDLGKLYETINKHYEDASWVGFRFAEVLPLDLKEKQLFLELNDPIGRLDALRPTLRRLREEQTQQ